MLHTKGPWKALTISNGQANIDGPNGESICIIGSVFGTPEENIANAHLIAASPTLLKMSIIALQALKSYIYGNSSPDLATEVAVELEKIISQAVY